MTDKIDENSCISYGCFALSIMLSVLMASLVFLGVVIYNLFSLNQAECTLPEVLAKMFNFYAYITPFIFLFVWLFGLLTNFAANPFSNPSSINTGKNKKQLTTAFLLFWISAIIWLKLLTFLDILSKVYSETTHIHCQQVQNIFLKNWWGYLLFLLLGIIPSLYIYYRKPVKT